MTLATVGFRVGSRVRVELCSGDIVVAEITVIEQQPSGHTLQVAFGTLTISIKPEQVVKVLEWPSGDPFQFMSR